MPQLRPRKRPPASGSASGAGDSAGQQVTVGGWHYTVDPHAVHTLKAAADQSDSVGLDAVRGVSDTVAVAEARATIGREGIQRAAKDAGAPRSASTANRWARENRIPDPRVAELVQRRAFVQRRGGVQSLAHDLGVSVTVVRRWQSGRTDSMRGASGEALRKARLDDARERAGVRDIVGARLRVRAQVQYRAHGSTSDEYRGARDIDIDMSNDEAHALFDALAADDYATANALCEASWSAWFGHAYSDNSGVHMLDVEDFGIDWY
ncbi:hypothetical protein OHB26_38720 (plasmid) [Nocardia sp. NBC_01503]|uniref:hypothetical protein n=1 Tax=Nocardia sp. NBC_01503 TaxID=2975997 RepID=UPI002E7B0DA4|nr:hypothetical protein [Nocardia sp. NBC_01503]WTL36612.1 hypothetical protein OHB26_38720 [Nocardia sp. NBC_01503]